MHVGERWYIVQHAYYHYVGTITSILGPKHVTLKDCVRVHSCSRNFTGFFDDGFKNDTVYTHWPDDTECSGWIVAAPFPHPIPEKKKKSS